MSWITLTDDQVFTADSQERASIVAIKGRDDLADVVGNVTEQFRDAIASRGNILGDDGTIPSGFKVHAINLALWLFITTGVARNDGIHTKERESASKAAQDFLQGIRDGKTSVELPPGATAVSPRTGTWNSENKLVMRTHPVPPPSTQFQSTDNTQRPYANPDGPNDN